MPSAAGWHSSQLSLSSAFSADLRTGGIYKSRPKNGTGQKDNVHICVRLRTRKDLCSKEIDTNHFWHLEAWTGVEIRFASFRSLGWSERSESPIFFKFFFSPKFSVKIVMLTYHAWRHCSSSGLFWGILKYGSSVFRQVWARTYKNKLHLIGKLVNFLSRLTGNTKSPF